MYLSETKRNEYIQYIKPLLTEKRFLHTLSTEKMAIKLASSSGENIADAQTAALLHDSYKCIDPGIKLQYAEKFNIPPNSLQELGTDIIHGQIAANMVKTDLNIRDENILNAIAFHTTGRPGMSRLEKIIYSADVVEESRVYDVADLLREAVYKDIDSGTYLVMNHVLQFLLKSNKPIYHLTVEAYNALLKEQKEI